MLSKKKQSQRRCAFNGRRAANRTERRGKWRCAHRRRTLGASMCARELPSPTASASTSAKQPRSRQRFAPPLPPPPPQQAIPRLLLALLIGAPRDQLVGAALLSLNALKLAPSRCRQPLRHRTVATVLVVVPRGTASTHLMPVTVGLAQASAVLLGALRNTNERTPPLPPARAIG